jgi:hypothetical protein
MSKVFFEAKVHSLNDGNKLPKDSKTHDYKLQVRYKDDDNDQGKIAEHRFVPPLKGSIPTMVVEADECGSNATLVFGYYRLETKSADTFLGSCPIKVHRGIEMVQADFEFKVPDDYASISMTVSITDVSVAQQYMNSLSSPNAPGKADPNKSSDTSVIPMLSIDDMFDTNEAETDSGESVKTFAKELSAQFDVNSQNNEELAIATMRICDFPVHPDAAHIPSLPSDADIMHVFGIHPAAFKKLRESSNRSSDAAGMNAYAPLCVANCTNCNFLSCKSQKL